MQYDAIFFSPHFDDAVLSAANQIVHLVKQKKRVLIVTYFGCASNTRQPAATSFLKNCQYIDPTVFFNDRSKEDRRAAALLGADVMHHSFVDAGFRTDHPTVSSVFNSHPTKKDLPLLQDMVTTTKKWIAKHAKADAQLYFPLGVGNHIDHHLVFLTSLDVWNPQSSQQLFYWEDVPYRHQTGATISRIADLNTTLTGLKKEMKSTLQYRPKIAAITAYTTQVPGLYFPGGLSSPYDFQVEVFWHA